MIQFRLEREIMDKFLEHEKSTSWMKRPFKQDAFRRQFLRYNNKYKIFDGEEYTVGSVCQSLY